MRLKLAGLYACAATSASGATVSWMLLYWQNNADSRLEQKNHTPTPYILLAIFPLGNLQQFPVHGKHGAEVLLTYWQIHIQND